VDTRLAPFQIVYFNALVGGFRGARARHLPQTGDYYGSSYRRLIPWMNENFEPNADVSILLCEHLVTLARMLRPDIHARYAFPDGFENGYAVYLYREDFMDDRIAYFEQNEKPIHTLDAEGIPLIKVYRVTPQVIKSYEEYVSKRKAPEIAP
jgi:hypothetical protein